MFGNRVTEADIRDWLGKSGYFGNSAKFHELELHALQRPGWQQIFRFTVSAKSTDDGWHKLFGVVKDDETKTTSSRKTIIVSFDNEQDQRAQLDDWSTELIQLKSKSQLREQWIALVCIFMFGLVFIGLMLLIRMLFE